MGIFEFFKGLTNPGEAKVEERKEIPFNYMSNSIQSYNKTIESVIKKYGKKSINDIIRESNGV